MRRHAWIGALLMALSRSARGWGGEPPCCPPPGDGFLQRFHPVGGWNPVRRRSAALVSLSLFSLLRRPGRLLSQAASAGVPAALSALLPMGNDGERTSQQEWLSGLPTAVIGLDPPRFGAGRRSPVDGACLVRPFTHALSRETNPSFGPSPKRRGVKSPCLSPSPLRGGSVEGLLSHPPG